MPTLNWPGKKAGPVQPARLLQDSIIFPGGRGYPDAAARDKLILGDNLRVMAALLPEYEGRINLIYADPPFFTNRKYSARIGRGEDSRRPEQWALAEGYEDQWDGLDAYLEFLYQRLLLMHRLLSSGGSLYVHLDWHSNSYARVLLDEIFGQGRLLNEIVWAYHGPSPIRRAFNRKHDTILAYAKDKDYTFNADAVRQPYNPSTVQTFRASPKAGFGKVPDLERGKVPEDWWYFPVVARLHKERTGYPTQKPEALLERIIVASSNAGDLVADFFCGSGTAVVVASRLDRRFIGCDATYRAVHTTRRRLCALQSAPFLLDREESASVPEADFSGGSVRLNEDKIALTEGDDIDYWELDPDWDGRLFRSAAQAQRSNHGATLLPAELPLGGGRRPCVRITTVKGELVERVLDV